MADSNLLGKAEGFIDEVLEAVADALTTNDLTGLEADLDSAVDDFTASLGPEIDKSNGRRDEDEPLLVIVKSSDDDERMIWGWGSVITVGGVPIVDRQDDIIELHELKAGVYDFMSNHRTGGEMHKMMGVGTVVESLVFSNELQKALGIDLGKEGWFVGVKVENDKTWARVKSGELKAFSLGGSAERVAVK